MNDLNDEQIQKLLVEVAPNVKELMEGVTLAIDYYKEGGYDRETWNRICDGLAHEAMNLMMALSAPAHPHLARDCERAVRKAAGITPRESGIREALQQQVAKGLLMSVLTVAGGPWSSLRSGRRGAELEADQGRPDHGEPARLGNRPTAGAAE